MSGTPIDVSAFLDFVRRLPGTHRASGMEFSRLADLWAADPGQLELALQSAAAQLNAEAGLSGDDYEKWSTGKRKRANYAAMVVLQRLREQPDHQMTAEERDRLYAYTGFGGFREIGVLTAPYPPLYVVGSQAWAQARRAYDRGNRSSPVPPTGAPGAGLFSGLRNQYFTPMPVCRAMWTLALRAFGHRQPHRVLETSAGSGRMVRAAPAGDLVWTLLEKDPLLVEILRALWPTALVLQTGFETWAATRGDNLYDLSIGNPPYGPRGTEARQADPAWSKITNDYSYFAARTATKLVPGGISVQLTKLGLLTSGAHADARAFLLRTCLFRGAAVLPSGTFPSVREGTYVASVWQRRALPVTEALTERENAVLTGRYLELPEARDALLGGSWRVSAYDRDKPKEQQRSYLYGKPTLDRMGQVFLAPVPKDETEALRQFQSQQASRGFVPSGLAQDTEDGVQLADSHQTRDRAESLASSVQAWLALIQTDPQEAEDGRDLLLQEISEFIAEFGNPHDLSDRKKTAAIRAVVELDGSPSRILTEPVADAHPSTRPRPGSTVVQVVRWFCDRRGVCTETDLVSVFRGMTVDDLLPPLLMDECVFVEVQSDGSIWFYTRENYLFGDLYDRISKLDAALGAMGEGALRLRMVEQKRVLLGKIAPRPLVEVTVTPRSGFVPLECLAEWVNHLVEESGGFKDLGGEELEASKVTLEVVTGRLRMHVPVWESMGESAQDRLRLLLAYWNRETQVEDPDQRATGRSAAYHGEDVMSRLNEEEALETLFKDWLVESTVWSPVVEDAYNKAFRSHGIVEVPADPVEVPGFNTSIRLRSHQNQAVRRATLGGQARSILLAHDVGAGKTLEGLVIAQYWRLMRTARRPLIVVPNSVLAKWHADARWAFPNARIGVIGLTPGRASPDNPEVRREKWLRFAAGGYDIAICTHSNFLHDVVPNMDEAEDVLAGMMWVQRGFGKEQEKRALHLRKIDNAQAEIELIEGALREEAVRAEEEANIKEQFERPYSRAAQDARRRLHKARNAVSYELWHELKKKLKRLRAGRGVEDKIDRLRKSIQGWQAIADEILPPTDSQVETVRQALQEFLRTKPFRPRERSSTAEGDVFTRPKPGLVPWDVLGVDALIVDEAHWYKNLWFPSARLGEQKIKYVGQVQAGNDWKIVQSAWDMYLKCMSITRRRGGEGGIVFLTATAVKNSPLEIYNLLSFLSQRIWADRKINSKEEFIDRYWRFESAVVGDLAGAVTQALVVKSFKNGDELHGIMQSYMDRRSIKDLIAAGIFSQEEIPTPVTEQVILERDPAQYAALVVCRAYRRLLSERMKMSSQAIRAQVRAEKEGLKPPPSVPVFRMTAQGDVVEAGRRPMKLPEGRKAISKGMLLVQDMMEKIAIDPRLLTEDFKKVTGWLTSDVATRAKYDVWQRDRKAGKRSRAPKRPLDDSRRETLELRVEILTYLNLPLLKAYYDRVGLVPKVRRLAECIRCTRDAPANDSAACDVACLPPGGASKCAHIVFVKYKSLIPIIAQAISHVAGVPRERIVVMTGSVARPKRLEISKQYNGVNGIWTDAHVKLGSRTIAKKAAVVVLSAEGDRLMVDGKLALRGKKAAQAVIAGRVSQERVVPAYDVIIGTDVMSEGIDLQRRTCAVHHLTMPWEPATVHQRNGRGVRQGAQEDEIRLYYYVTRKTFDGIKYSTVVGKAAWQEALFAGVSEISNPAAGAEMDEYETSLYLEIEDDEAFARAIAEHRKKKEEEAHRGHRIAASTALVQVNNYYAKARAARDEAARAAAWALAARRLEEHRNQFGDVTPTEVYSRIPSNIVAFEAATGQFFSKGDIAQTTDGSLYSVIDVDARRRYILTLRAYGNLSTTVMIKFDHLVRAPRSSWDIHSELSSLKPRRATDITGISQDLVDKGVPGKLWRTYLERHLEQLHAGSRPAAFTSHMPLKNRAGQVFLLSGDLHVLNNYDGSRIVRRLLNEFSPVTRGDWHIWVQAVREASLFYLEVSKEGPTLLEPTVYFHTKGPAKDRLILTTLGMEWWRRKLSSLAARTRERALRGKGLVDHLYTWKKSETA